LPATASGSPGARLNIHADLSRWPLEGQHLRSAPHDEDPHVAQPEIGDEVHKLVQEVILPPP